MLGSKKFAPFEKGGIAEFFESDSAFDITLMVEGIVDMTPAFGAYALNPISGRWDRVTIYPSRPAK